MAEIIREPESTHVVHHVENDNSSNSAALLIGIAFVVILAIIFFFYALPMINRAATPTQVNVPERVDVNLNQGQ